MDPEINAYLASAIDHLSFLGKQDEARVINALVILAKSNNITGIGELFASLGEEQEARQTEEAS